MSHIKDRLNQYKDKYSDCYKYAGVYVKVVQDMIEKLQEDLEQDEKEKGWIIVKYHKITDAERKENGYSEDIEYYLDGLLPDDGQEIIVTDGENTWCDTCSVNSDVEYGLESCIDWIEIKAWMPLPEPYKEGGGMRLIDADKLKKDILLQNILGEPIQKIIDRYIHIVDEQPTVFDVDKVVEQLEKRSTLAKPVGWTKSYEIVILNDAVEIVKGGGVE